MKFHRSPRNEVIGVELQREIAKVSVRRLQMNVAGNFNYLDRN